MPDTLALALLLGGGASVLAQSTPLAPGDQVSFTGAEIAVVGGLLGIVAGAVSLLYRSLMASKDQRIADYREETATLHQRITTVLADKATIEKQLIEAFQGGLRTNEQAVAKLLDRFDQFEQANERRHAEFMAAMGKRLGQKETP